MNIPVSMPDMSDLERDYAKQAVDSGWISSQGPWIGKFEDKWAKYNGYPYGASCNSGTNALFLALKALGIKEGDEVIMSDFTMIACAWVVSYCGATPIFVDCKDDLTINEELIEAKITSKTRIIMPVHIYGRQCNMDKIMDIAYQYNLFVVEDLAEAHGVMPRGDIACYSFYGNKIITTGEGGMCLTNDKRLYEQIQHIKSMAFDKNHTFLHKKMGYNFRMTNIQAAIGCAQVERIEELLVMRRRVEQWYDKYIPKEMKMPKRDMVWMYDINAVNQNEVKNKLDIARIDSRYFFKPMTMQPMYKQEVGKNAFKWSKRGLYLPTYPTLTEDNIKYICQTLL